jgi:TonB family protein
MERYFFIASISSIVLYNVYYLFLRKESFHQFNRFYLLGALVFSLVIPLLQFSIPVSMPISNNSVSIATEETLSLKTNITEFITYIQLPEFTVFAPSHSTVSWWNIANVFLTVYLLGVVVGGVFFIIKLIKIFLLIIQSSKHRNENYIYMKYDENMAPFSFFNCIFINADAYNEEDYKRILLHEQTHVRQRHSWDLIFVELITILLWFNPVLILYKRSLQVTHEYLADYRVLQHGFEQGAYLNLLLRQLTLQNVWMIGHHFNFLLTKNRFKMLKNNHYSKWALTKVVFALPFIALILMLNCKNKSQEVSTSEEFTPKTIVIESNEGIAVITEITPELEQQKETNSQSKAVKDYKTTYTQLVEQGKTWDFNPFLKELQSEFVRFSEENFLISLTTDKPDFLEFYSDTHKKLYEAQRDESGKIYVTELATGEVNPDYLNVSKEDVEDDPKRFVEVMPEPTGGLDAMYNFLQENLKYPEEARKKGISGRVLIEFVIERDGRITNVKVIHGTHPDLDAEALRVVKMMPKWKPGTQNGEPVRCFYQIPVMFTLN